MLIERRHLGRGNLPEVRHQRRLFALGGKHVQEPVFVLTAGSELPTEVLEGQDQRTVALLDLTDEEHPYLGPLLKEPVVLVTPIHQEDTAAWRPLAQRVQMWTVMLFGGGEVNLGEAAIATNEK